MAIEQHSFKRNNFDNDDVSFKELILKASEWLDFLKLKSKIIIISVLIGGLIGFFIAWFDKPIYKATLTFAMEEDKGSGGSGLSGALGLASSFGIDLGGSGGGAFAATNLSELMKSRLIIEKVLFKPVIIDGETTTLIEYYIKINKLREKWKKNPYLKSLHFKTNLNRENLTKLQDSVIKVIHKILVDKKNLSISQKDKKVTILSIEVNSYDEIFAKIFCENLAKETSDLYIETRSKKARINTNVLQKQVDSIKLELDKAITNTAAETDFVYNLNPAFNVKSAPSKKSQIDVQANIAILTNLSVQLELAKITLRKETPLIQLIDKPILPLEKNKFDEVVFLILGGFLSGILTLTFLILRFLFSKGIAG